MRLVNVKGVPHWFDGEIFLPVMAGGQTKPPKTSGTGGGGPTGGGAGIRPGAIIDSTGDLKKFIRDYEDRTLLSIINELAKRGARLSPAFYGELQDAYLKAEAKTGTPFSILSGAEGAGPTIREALESGSLTGSTSAADNAAANYRAELQAQVDREKIAEDKRQSLLTTARALVEKQMEAKSAAQTQGVTLAGSDPFKFIGQLRGQDIAAGVQTPYDIFKGYLQGQATQESPNIIANATTQDLESALGKLEQLKQQGQNAPSFGFAGGGTANAFGPYQANLVGEAGSQIAPGTEVMITGATLIPRPGETTILPLQSGMETGGTVGSEGLLKPGSLGVFPQLFEKIRSGLGNTRANLGYLPEGSTDIGNLGGPYGGLTTPLSQNLKRGYGELVKLGKISQADADFVVNAIGEIPNPRNARQWFSTLTPTELQAVQSLYKIAYTPPEEFNAMVKSALLSGPPRSSINLAA